MYRNANGVTAATNLPVISSFADYDTNETKLMLEDGNFVHHQVEPTVETAATPQQQQHQQLQNQQQCHQPQVNVFNRNLQYYQPAKLEAEQQDNREASFGLDEINAVINSKDFEYTNYKQEESHQPQNQLEYQFNGQQQQKHQDYSEYQTVDETPEFYTFNQNQEDADTRIMASNNNNNNNNNNTKSNQTKNNYSLFVNQIFDANKTKPYIEIVEQPAKCALRFRYKCEGRSAGSLPGVNSTQDNKTFPAIKIHNYAGRVAVVISCVTKDAPYRAHPHNIVGKEGCKKGICSIKFTNEANTVRSFTSLGIQCVKRKDIEESLALRESINVDPFRNGFSHKLCASNIDLNVVRLCFQVFLEGSTPNTFDVPLVPAVSEPIHDKKAMSDLVITKLSHCSAPATGGREVILLCDRISKDDIQIRFYEERDGRLVWETHTELSPADVHKQVAICFKTPKYFNENITQPVMARIQLKRMSDNQLSEPRLFQFLPCESDEDIISRKRQKIEWVNSNHRALDIILQPQHHHHRPQQAQQQPQHHQQPQPQFQHHHPHHQPPTQPQQHPQQPQQQHQHHELNPRPASSQRRASPSSHMNASPAQGTVGCNNGNEPTQRHRQDFSPSPSQLQRRDTSPNQPATTQHQDPHGAILTPQPTPSPSNQPRAGDVYLIDNSQNLVVRREIIDTDGKVMRLVDRTSSAQPQQSQPQGPAHQQQQLHQEGEPLDNRDGVQNQKALGSSLDRIDTSELMRDMQFNSNMDLNLGSNLSLHLNGS